MTDYTCEHCHGTGVNIDAVLRDARMAQAIAGDASVVGLSVKDAAHALGVGETTMKRLLATGAIPSRTIGTRRIVAREALEEYLRQPETGGETWQAKTDVPIIREVFGDREPTTTRGRSTKQKTATGKPSSS